MSDDVGRARSRVEDGGRVVSLVFAQAILSNLLHGIGRASDPEAVSFDRGCVCVCVSRSFENDKYLFIIWAIRIQTDQPQHLITINNHIRM